MSLLITGYKYCECILFLVLSGLANLDGAILQNELLNNKVSSTETLLNQKSMNVWDTSRIAT